MKSEIEKQHCRADGLENALHETQALLDSLQKEKAQLEASEEERRRFDEEVRNLASRIDDLNRQVTEKDAIIADLTNQRDTMLRQIEEHKTWLADANNR